MRRQITLSEGWHIREWAGSTPDLLSLQSAEGQGWLSARMPAEVQDILLAHKLIPDPLLSKGAAECAWVAERDWLYFLSFPTPSRSEDPAYLRFRGIDTLATVFLNGREIAYLDNMHREYVVPVGDDLAPVGEDNRLILLFHSPVQAIDQIEQPSALSTIIPKHKYLRKTPQDFSSYLGARPHFITLGVHDDVILDLPDRAWFEDVWVRSELAPDHERASVLVQVETQGCAATLAWSVTDPSGVEVSSGSAPAGDPLEIPIEHPDLWWPHTHGQASLYVLTAQLVLDGQICDERIVPFGIRQVRLETTDSTGEQPRFRFTINGRPLFLQGAGMAPFDGKNHVYPPDRVHRLLDLAVHARMNLLRVWGGGDIPADDFYRECDRRGILVWQDFMFGYGTYPDHDSSLNEGIRVEAESLVRRLRNHPSLLIWVGGNENHMGYDFEFGGEPPVGRTIFEEILPSVCARLDPTRPYHISSPHGGPAPNWPLIGDWHDYTTVTYSHESSVPLFASETGRVSAPSLASMRRFLSEDEIWPSDHAATIGRPGQPSWPPMWGYRAADGAWEKIGPIEAYCEPTSARELIRVLGTAHGEYLFDRVARERRGLPDGAGPGERRCWGNMIWRLNDAWPTIYWSVVDYYTEPKIPYYFLRRAYAPLLLSFERTPDDLCVWLTNDSADTYQGELIVERCNWRGQVIQRTNATARSAPGQSTRFLDTTPLGPISLRHEFLLARCGNLQETCLLIGERYLDLPKAGLQARIESGQIEVSTEYYARQVSLEIADVTGAVFEDNYFDLVPGQSRRIAIHDTAEGRYLIVRCVNDEPIGLRL